MKWPDEELIPGFRDVLERYLVQVEDLSYKFTSLIAEAFGLGPDGLAQFYDIPPLMQHRAKIVQYPVAEGSSNQGVGPHYDAGFLTFVRFQEIESASHENRAEYFLLVVASFTSPWFASTKSSW